MSAAMAALPGGLTGATLLEVEGYDPYRVYEDSPVTAGWRQNQDQISGQRYWTHVQLRCTTRSLGELVRLQGMEEFLLLGEWSLFAVVPDDLRTYEDVNWKLEVFATDRLEQPPLRRLDRGSLVVSLSMARPNVIELLVPSEDGVVQTVYAGYRFPPSSGGARQLHKLPARWHQEDLVAMSSVTVPNFRVLPILEEEGHLLVTAARDPRSPVVGHLTAGDLVGLSVVIGTRAQISRTAEKRLRGGWMSIMRLDATPTIVRILEETENMINERKLEESMQRHLEESKDRRQMAEALKATQAGGVEEPQAQPEEKAISAPSVKSQVPPRPEPIGQRQTLTGGWRQVLDPIWRRPLFVYPLSGRATWGLAEVLGSGGTDDLLLARHWEVCAVDPLAVEVMKDQNWAFNVYADPGLTGEPVARLTKGTLIVVQVFTNGTYVCTVLLPPATKGGQAATGYGNYRQRDGRPLLRAFLPQAEADDEKAGKGGVFEEETRRLGFAEPPEGDLLEGPFFVAPREGAQHVPVTVGQDIGSEHWARLPRGYRVQSFAEVLGLRARLHDLEGGGWVNLVEPDGTPNFRKEPATYVAQDGPEEEQDAAGAHFLPVVWPGLGILRPPLPLVKAEEKAVTEVKLPSLLKRLGGGRVLCDWQRMTLPPYNVLVWKSPLTGSQTMLDDLLRNNCWKASVVERELSIREHGDPRSKIIASRPWGSLVVSEWVAPGNAVRILTPREKDDPKPAHGFTDLGGADGASLVPLTPGSHFWVEPLGGHLPKEEQEGPANKDPASMPVRAGQDPGSEIVGYFWRGDAVQMCEITGRKARVVLEHMAVFRPNAPPGGWIEFFDEAGWSVLKAKRPGEVHSEETRRQRLAECEEWEEEHHFSPPPTPEVAELPPLLCQLAELEQASICTRDWREAVDPIWGHRYFINKWSGQILRNLESMGVACATVRLTMWWTNLSLEALHHNLTSPDLAFEHMEHFKHCIHGSLAALADVPEDMTEVHIEEGPYEGSQKAAETSQSDDSMEDSITGGSRRNPAKDDDLSRFRIVCYFRAPGVYASWASAALKEAMTDAGKFTAQILSIICSIPHMDVMKIDHHDGFYLFRADLEELDMPRPALCFKPPPPPEEDPPPPVDHDIADLRTNLRWAKPTLLQIPNKHLGDPTGNAQALADGLMLADEPHLEEVGLWSCSLGDFGAVALAGALDHGIGAKLQTLILDHNNIAAAGATALGAGLAKCSQLRELCVARNPLGKGFAALVKGLGASLTVLDASEAALDDAAAQAAAACLPHRWPALRSLRMAGCLDIGAKGVESLAKALLGAPSVKLVDLKGCTPGPEWPRLSKLLQRGGSHPGRLRV